MSERGPAVLRPRRELPGRVQALTTTRRGGLATGSALATLSLGGADPSVPANRERLVRGLGLPNAPVYLGQVHGVDTVELTGGESADALTVDAAFTRVPGLVCAVLTADCLPVVLAARSGDAVAVAHAGWRGLSGGILERVAARMPVDPAELVAWLGPAIGPRAFEVGPEVRAAFLAADPGAVGAFFRGTADRWFADLYMLARRRLHRAGVPTVRGGGHCTVGESRRFFSHRRDGAGCGRMATLAWLAPGEGA